MLISFPLLSSGFELEEKGKSSVTATQAQKAARYAEERRAERHRKAQLEVDAA